MDKNNDNNLYSWSFDLRDGFTLVKSKENSMAGLLKKEKVILPCEYADIELVSDAPCIIATHYGSENVPVRKLFDLTGKEIPASDYEKVSGKSPAQFLTRAPIFGGFRDGFGIDHWETNVYDASLSLIDSYE